MRPARLAVMLALLLGVVVLGLAGAPAAGWSMHPAEKLPEPTAARRDPRGLVFEPGDAEVPDLLPLFVDTVRPGEPFAYPIDVVNDVIVSRRFVAGAMTTWESADGTLIVHVTTIDLGDPRVLASVDLDEWVEPAGPGFPAGAMTRPDTDAGDPYAEFDVAWQRGPLFLVIVTTNLAQQRTRGQVAETVGRVALSVDAQIPELPVVAPVRPATSLDEASTLAAAVMSNVLGLVALRWFVSWVRDPAARRRLVAHVDRRLGRAPPEASSFFTDVTRPATAYLWATRLVAAVQLLVFAVLIGLSAAVFVLVDAGHPIVPSRVALVVAVIAVVWCGAPPAARLLCRVLSGGVFTPSLGERGSTARRWLSSPGALTVTLVGVIGSVVLTVGGLFLLVRAAAVDTTGALGAVGPESTDEMNEGYRILGIVLLGLTAVPYTITRRLAQRSLSTAVLKDRRPRILLLRSFADDRVRIRAHRTARRHPLTRMRLTTRDRFEEVLVWALWRSGPVTALSQPGSKLQPLGATRVHYADEDWRSAVRHLISTSALIVVVIDDTQAVLEEIGMLRELGALDRTLFVVPPVSVAQRRKRLTWLDEVLSTWTIPPRLEQATEVLAVRVSSRGEIHAFTARFREDLAYEVAVEQAVDACYRPQLYDVAAPQPRDRRRAAPRGARPKDRRGVAIWGVALTLSIISSSVSRVVPDLGGLELRGPDDYLDVATHVDQISQVKGRTLIVPVARSGFLVAARPPLEGWVHELPASERVREVALGPTLAALSTYESPTVHLFDAVDGTPRGTVPLGEPTGAMAITDRFVVAARSHAGDVVVTDLAGSVVAAVPVSGVPTGVAADDERIVVVAERTSTVDVIDLADMSRQSIDVGPGVRGVALAGATAYVSQPEADRLVALDLSANRVSGVAVVPDQSPGMSHFASTVAVGDHYVAVPLYAPPGSFGFASVDRDTLRVHTTWGVGHIGAPNQIVAYGDTVYCGFVETDGVYGWSLDGPVVQAD